jgi:hypothetical protein
VRIGRFLCEVKQHIFLTGFHAFMGKCLHDGPLGFGILGCRLYGCFREVCRCAAFIFRVPELFSDRHTEVIRLHQF